MKYLLIFTMLLMTTGMSCPNMGNLEGIQVEQDGKPVAGRICTPREDGGKCCTTTAPIKGKMTSVTVCYGPDGKEEK